MFSENLQRQEYFRKISWMNSRNQIVSQLSLDDINEKQMKSLGEGHLQKLPCGIPVVTHFFSLTEALMYKFIIKELRCNST